MWNCNGTRNQRWTLYAWACIQEEVEGWGDCWYFIQSSNPTTSKTVSQETRELAQELIRLHPGIQTPIDKKEVCQKKSSKFSTIFLCSKICSGDILIIYSQGCTTTQFQPPKLSRPSLISMHKLTNRKYGIFQNWSQHHNILCNSSKYSRARVKVLKLFQVQSCAPSSFQHCKILSSSPFP